MVQEPLKSAISDCRSIVKRKIYDIAGSRHHSLAKLKKRAHNAQTFNFNESFKIQ